MGSPSVLASFTQSLTNTTSPYHTINLSSHIRKQTSSVVKEQAIVGYNSRYHALVYDVQVDLNVAIPSLHLDRKSVV